MMSSTVILILGLLPAALFVLWPLFAGDAAEIEPAPAEDPRAVYDRQKQAAYAAIKEAEFDRRTGKLSEDDHETLTSRYRQQALEAIAALEKLSVVKGRRAAPEVIAVRFCPDCGTKTAPGANFCGSCGASLANARASA